MMAIKFPSVFSVGVTLVMIGLFGCQQPDSDSDSARGTGPVNVNDYQLGQSSSFTNFVLELDGTITPYPEVTMREEIVSHTGSMVQFSETVHQPNGFHTGTFHYNVDLATGKIDGDTDDYFHFRYFLLSAKENPISSMLSGAKILCDGPIPKPQAMGSKVLGYAENYNVGGKTYLKVAMVCESSSIPDVGSSCAVFSPEGVALRVIGFGGFINARASYTDLVPNI